MYRTSEIVSSFLPLVGWRDSKTLTRSDSGLFFEEAHPLLTMRAMRGIMPEGLWRKYAPYEQKAYAKGEKVSSLEKVYESIIDNNTLPVTDPIGWKEYDVLDDYLKTITESGIKRVVTRFANDKMSSLESKNIVERRTLFDGAGRKEAKNPNKGRLVGFEFSPLRADGITASLNKVGLQFVGNVGDITLYLFHSSQSEPIAQKTLSYTKDGGFMWFDLEWVMPYVTENTNAGGNWYVVYDESALPSYMQSINFGRDWSREPCGTCNKGDAVLYRTLMRHIGISPFYVTGFDGVLWDTEDMQYTAGNNYGLNFMVTVSCDITDAILAEGHLFANAIQMQVATEALRALALNPEVSVNRTQYNADRDNILFEMSGNGQGIKGLQGDLEKAYKALSIDTKGLSPLCLGCHNRGIRYGAI